MGEVMARGTSDSGGRFRVHTNYLHVNEFAACAVVEALVLATETLIRSDGLPVVIRVEGQGMPLDSVWVDLREGI